MYWRRKLGHHYQMQIVFNQETPNQQQQRQMRRPVLGPQLPVR